MSLPRVTDILSNFTGYEYVPKTILENAATRGTAVHGICAGIAKGAWTPETMVEEDLQGYVESFKKWKEAQVKSFMIVEKRYYDDQIGFTGQVDFVIEANDSKKYLIDIKTSAKPYKTHSVQMGAYSILLASAGILIDGGAMLVYLQRTGAFPDIILLEDMEKERSVFLSALECYNYFHGRKNATRE